MFDKLFVKFWGGGVDTWIMVTYSNKYLTGWCIFIVGEGLLIFYALYVTLSKYSYVSSSWKMVLYFYEIRIYSRTE